MKTILSFIVLILSTGSSKSQLDELSRNSGVSTSSTKYKLVKADVFDVTLQIQAYTSCSSPNFPSQLITIDSAIQQAAAFLEDNGVEPSNQFINYMSYTGVSQKKFGYATVDQWGNPINQISQSFIEISFTLKDVKDLFALRYRLEHAEWLKNFSAKGRVSEEKKREMKDRLMEECVEDNYQTARALCKAQNRKLGKVESSSIYNYDQYTYPQPTAVNRNVYNTNLNAPRFQLTLEKTKISYTVSTTYRFKNE